MTDEKVLRPSPAVRSVQAARLRRLPRCGVSRARAACGGVRVVPNRFPIFAADKSATEGDGSVSAAARGRHGVVIESPIHDWDPGTAQPNEVRNVLLAYRVATDAAVLPGTQQISLRRDAGTRVRRWCPTCG